MTIGHSARSAPSVRRAFCSRSSKSRKDGACRKASMIWRWAIAGRSVCPRRLRLLVTRLTRYMSTTESVRNHIRIPRGKPFTSSRLAAFGSRGAVDRALARLVERGEIERLARGAFVRPRKNRYIGNVLPGVDEVVHTLASARGETIQIHGAEAARRLGLTPRRPLRPYTTPARPPVRSRSAIPPSG